MLRTISPNQKLKWKRHVAPLMRHDTARDFLLMNFYLEDNQYYLLTSFFTSALIKSKKTTC